MKQAAICFALFLLLLSGCPAAWLISLDVEPTTRVFVDPANVSLGDLSSAKTAYIHIINDGNVPLRITLVPNGIPEAQALATVDEWEEGACSARLSDTNLSSQPVELCRKLGYVNSADDIRLRLKITPNEDGTAGSYEAVFGVLAESEYANDSQNITIEYTIKEKPKAIIRAPESSSVGTPAAIKVVGSDDKPLANAVIEVRSGSAKAATLVTNSLGEASFEAPSEGNYTYTITGYQAQAAGTTVRKPNIAEQASAALSDANKLVRANPLFSLMPIVGALFLLAMAGTYIILRKGNAK